jgi:hypothetical protein
VIASFWAVCAFAFVFGVGGLAGFIFFYWLFVIPARVLHDSPPVQRERRSP